MLRITPKHPVDCGFWWAGMVGRERLANPDIPADAARWETEEVEAMVANVVLPHSIEAFLRDDTDVAFLPSVWRRVKFAPAPFAEGSMRLAHYAFINNRYYVLKCFNDDTRDFIKDALKTTYGDAVMKDIRCQLFAMTAAKSSIRILCAWVSQ